MLNPANMFMMMAGQTYFGSKLSSAATNLTKTFSKRLLRGYKNVEIYNRSKTANLVNGRLSKFDAMSARRVAYQKHRSVTNSINSFSRSVQAGIQRYTPIGGRADRKLGKLFNMTGGNKSKAFSSHIGSYMFNDLATAPLTYAMYRYDKTQYPEMQNQSFASYYAETIPMNLGFMSVTSGMKGIGRQITHRVANKLKHSQVAKTAFQMGLHAGSFASKKMDSHLAYTRDMKDGLVSAVSGAISMRSLQGFGTKIMDTHNRSVRDTSKSIFGLDEKLIESTLSQHNGDKGFLRNLKSDLNDTAKKDVNLFTFMSKFVKSGKMEMTSQGLYDRGEESISRGIYKYKGKNYDLRAFSLGKMRDAAANFMDTAGFETGPVAGHLKPFKILQSGFGFLRSEYTKSVQSIHFGGSDKKINDQTIKFHAMEEFDGMNVEDWNLKKNNATRYNSEIKNKAVNIYSKILGGDPEEARKKATSHLAWMRNKDKNNKNFYTQLISGMQKDGSLELPKDTVFFVGNDGMGKILNMERPGNVMHLEGLGKIGNTSIESKISASEYQMRISGGNHTRSKTIEELMESRRATDPKWKPGLWDEMKLKWELGGGPGTRSIWDMAEGYISKFKDNSFVNNIFTKEYVNEIKRLPKRQDTLRHATYTQTLDKSIVYSNYNQYMTVTNNGNNWKEFMESMKDYKHHTHSGEEISYGSISLRGKKTIHEMHAALNAAETYTKDINNTEIGNYINMARKQLDSNGGNHNGRLDVKMFEGGATLLDQYEASIFQSFGIHGKARKDDVEQFAMEAMFETTRTLKGNNIASAHNKIMKAHAKMKEIGNIKLSSDSSHEEIYKKMSEDLLQDFVVNNEFKKETIDMIGKNVSSYSKMGDQYKFNAHNTNTMFLFKEGGAIDPKFKKVKYSVGNQGEPDYKEVENVYSTRAVGTAGMMLHNSLNTFNKALGLLGLGVEHYRSTQELGVNLMKKRVLPMAGGVAGLYAADNFFDSSPLFSNTPLSEGLLQVPMNAYAGLRLGSQGIMDAAGVTAASKYMEDLMPGAINSPGSGLVRGVLPFVAGTTMGYKTAGTGGAVKGGLIGGAVSMLLGGGLLGFYGGWDISKNRAETLAELKGEKETEIRKGRWWLMSGGSFWGNERDHFGLSFYAKMRSDYQDSPNYKTSVGTELMSYLDPSVYNRMHYYSRPSLESPGVLSNVPVLGKMLNLGNEKMHSEYDSILKQRAAYKTEARKEAFDSYTNNQLNLDYASGTGPSAEMENSFYGAPVSGDSLEMRMGKSLYNLKEVAGLRGFSTEVLQDKILGSKQAYSELTEIEAPNISSLGRSFLDLSLGDLGPGLTEGIRRILPKKPGDYEVFNPVRNIMPEWISGSDYFLNLKRGDPYASISEGELRLPGEGLETARDIRPETPGEADLLGLSPEESMGFYSGDLNIVVPRYFHGDRIIDHKNRIINELKSAGSLIKEQSLVYDTGRNISATVDATYENENGEIVPVKFVPYLSDQKGFLSGSASGLNAYLSLSGQEKGLLIGIDEKGNTTEAIIRKDVEKYKQEAAQDVNVRAQSYDVTIERRKQGLPTAPGLFYSHLDRLKILSDVAFYSREYKNELKIVKAQIKAGKLDESDAMKVEEIEDNVEKMKFKKIFMDEKFGLSFQGDGLSEETRMRQEAVRDKYNVLERGIGKLWEDVSTARNPIISKLIGNRTAMDAYRNEVLYGEQMPQWDTPIDSYVKPFVNKMAVEDNIFQGGLSGSTAGFLMGGGVGAAMGTALGAAWSATGGQILNDSNWVPEDVQKSRQIMAAADQGERERYAQLYEQTGYREYRIREMSTQNYVLENGAPITEGRVINLANKPEKAYLKDMLANATSSNLEDIQRLLPQDVGSLINKSLGQEVKYNARESAGDYVMNPEDVSNYSAPVDDIIVRTMEKEGLSAHKVGLGWHKSQMRMNQMEALGMDIPEMGSREQLPQMKQNAKLNGHQLKGLLMNVLKEEKPNIILTNDDGPLTIIVEIT